MDNNKNIEQPHEWWRGSVIYQIYPRSFKDTNGDGIGDIAGIIEKLDYISTLGVDAIWISPFFESPMKDFGYDISDYRKVDSIFGSNDDFDCLIKRGHQLGLKIIIDHVLSHTSDQHHWFKQSRADKSNPKADWYVWADAQYNGKPPNNWLSIFGGSAWQWDETRGQYYLHNFLTSQPDLNFHSQEVREQMLKEVEYWLERGVDGLRLDAISYCFHDALLRSNPPKPMDERFGRGFSPENPYAAQYHHFDNTQPENLGFLEELRLLLDRYPETVSLGEVNSEDSLKTLAEYTEGDHRLHMGYSFELLADEFSAEYIRNTVVELETRCSNGWPCWAISNHDVSRVVSRWGKSTNSKAAFAKLLIALLGSLRGTICTYQGEELGLTEANIEKHEVQDPFGKEFWPDFKGRDGCRTPMPWSENNPNADFTDATPWLPIPMEHLQNSIENQENDSNSVLNFYRHFMRWRGNQPCLKWGSIAFSEAHKDLLIIERRYKDSSIKAYFNLSDKAVSIPMDKDRRVKRDAPSSINVPQSSESQLNLNPFAFSYME